MQTGLLELFASLDANEVRYVLVGGLAAVLHGVPRATFDVDLLIERDLDNARRLLDALDQAGFRTAGQIDAHRLLGNPITIFEDVVRVDVFLSIPGLTFDEAWAHHDAREASPAVVRLISLDDLIRSKLARSRPRDLEDVEDLRHIQSKGRGRPEPR
jgi:hypothetical protein